MGKARRGSKEVSREQKLIQENRILKRELSHIRKQIARLDGDRVETLRQMCADQEETKRFEEINPPVNLDNLKKDWACKQSECLGFLEIVLYSKINQTYYYRQCNSCLNRTKGKRYDSKSVKGILKNG